MYKATNHYIIKKQKIKKICIYETLNHVKECASRRSYGRSALQARKKHCFGTRFGTGNGGDPTTSRRLAVRSGVAGSLRERLRSSPSPFGNRHSARFSLPSSSWL